MKTKSFLWIAGLVLALAAVGTVAVEGALHFALARSAPEANSSVESPGEIRLWFTQVPQDNSVGIRLITRDGNAIVTGDPVPDAEDGKVFSIAVSGPLPGGPYTVSWRGIGDDGHVVRGEFPFTVRAE